MVNPKTRIIRQYSELIQLPTFKERFDYLNLTGKVGASIWGAERYLNQSFYRSRQWAIARRDVIARDLGYDLGLEDYPIFDSIYVHHMTPITIEDISDGSPYLLDPRYLISTSLATHNDIHYGTYKSREIVERRPNDHILW